MKQRSKKSEQSNGNLPIPKKKINDEKVKSWLAPLASLITAIVAVFGVHHQIQIDQANRKLEHEKWEASFQNQIQLAETNRQRDFLIWQKQRSEEWSQQLQILLTQRKEHDLVEKETLYQDFIFHLL